MEKGSREQGAKSQEDSSDLSSNDEPIPSYMGGGGVSYLNGLMGIQ